MGSKHLENPHFLNYFQIAEEITGLPLKEVMTKGPFETLSDTRYTQPALILDGYVVRLLPSFTSSKKLNLDYQTTSQ